MSERVVPSSYYGMFTRDRVLPSSSPPPLRRSGIPSCCILWYFLFPRTRVACVRRLHHVCGPGATVLRRVPPVPTPMVRDRVLFSYQNIIRYTFVVCTPSDELRPAVCLSVWLSLRDPILDDFCRVFVVMTYHRNSCTLHRPHGPLAPG